MEFRSPKMSSIKFHAIFLVLLSVNYVSSLPGDVEHLREHFITNLLEENREKLQLMLTDEIQQSIDQKVDAFLHAMEEPKVRKRRDTNDLLPNEKGEWFDSYKNRQQFI
jgi:hypothetical protein